ncbi:hypothetical protein QBC32DRAFT_71356 [Pseudoneurospora amorphoporcata]|uniref:Uncharacterized protein n=1 Tax=Pseudoneurospora amorphoporcata TaxID=241081 RepID=A0AAN6SJ27_9PEZI|nr:hypothetical protein QBC32DRAFT_71356 [Pseudoneurospora amorphoporcata]
MSDNSDASNLLYRVSKWSRWASAYECLLLAGPKLMRRRLFKCCPSFSAPPLVPTTACSLQCPSLVKPSLACDLRHRIRSPPRNSLTFLHGPPLASPVTRTMIYQSSDAPPFHLDSHNIGPKSLNEAKDSDEVVPSLCALIPSSLNQIGCGSKEERCRRRRPYRLVHIRVDVQTALKKGEISTAGGSVASTQRCPASGVCG